MKIPKKLLKDLGYTGTSGLAFYKKFPDRHEVVVIHFSPCLRVFRYKMKPSTFRGFVAGKFTIVPPGTCNPSGGKEHQGKPETVINQVDYNARLIKEVLQSFEASPYKFSKGNGVRHLKTGHVYEILRTPELLRIEMTAEPAYEYQLLGKPWTAIWVRGQGEMEDGRYEQIW